MGGRPKPRERSAGEHDRCKVFRVTLRSHPWRCGLQVFGGGAAAGVLDQGAGVSPHCALLMAHFTGPRGRASQAHAPRLALRRWACCFAQKPSGV